ncbi:TetR/AcrR family transcriptional regulator [Kribbella sp. NPDC026596]|uniref:TetR/AcrR family transcriptional regulator n=1 Tax=Kribbella sp. NPDC026596 TaxID=3155122 RepID=UPI0033F2D672
MTEPTTGKRRADAVRNVEAIVEAVLNGGIVGGELNMAAVARLAGVSRVTLYSHFPSRQSLVEAAVDRAIAESEQLVEELRLDLDPPPVALDRFVSSSWRMVDKYHSLYTAATTELPTGRLTALHGPLLGRMRTLILRGRRDGSFRTDLSVDWLVATAFSLMHQAAEEVEAGRLSARKAGSVISATLLPVLRRE